MLNLPNIRIVGLTGTSGAGKTTVCGVFAERGYEIIDCDAICRDIAKNGDFLREVSEKISPSLITPAGELDRGLTARLIFGDGEKRGIYNSLIYPRVIYETIRRIKCAKRALLDAPTLFEARMERICTVIVAVIADEEKCAERIGRRDNIPPELARARLSAQHSAGFFRENSDLIIENNGTEEQLKKAAIQITEQLERQ